MFLVIDKYKLSEWLQREMKDQNLNQSELARRSGLNRAVINKIINQISAPTAETLEAIARGLRKPPDDVLRIAGILPPIPEERSMKKELSYIADLLNDENLREVLDYARHRLEKQRDKTPELPTKQSSREKKAPARSVLKGD